jgi:hypothetical protein
VGNISVDYDVLNQKGSPAWYSDLFANIPTPGYKGRMFISTDTFAFYRDNGVGWDLVGGPGTGTITGSGVSGQLTYFIGTDVISGNNNLFYDITNGRLGINTATPGAPLDIHTTGTAAQFNGTTTNNAFVFFQNAGTSKWRIGNLYNSGANDYQIYDVLNATARLTIKNTGATTLTGTFTATSLEITGGTSAQFLKANGSVDSNIYLTTSNAATTYLALTGGSLTGNLEILNGNSFYLYNTGSTTYWWQRNNANTYELKYGASTTPLTILNTGAATFLSSVTATSFVKTSGTSAQILAADGSVITAGTNITISGGTISATGGGSMAIGSSITSATAGSVLYAGASGVLAQSNSNFYYDYTNNRLFQRG